MKFLALLPIILSVQAKFEDIISGVTALEKASKNITGVEGRAFQGIIKTFLEEINNYGCWCNFGDEYVNGRGAPQDFIDNECKNLVQGYRCIVIDALERGEECEPATSTTYTAFQFFGSQNELVQECTTTMLVINVQLIHALLRDHLQCHFLINFLVLVYQLMVI